MKEIPLDASILSGFTYDADGQQLWLRFRTGHLYVYQMVPATVIQALIEAPSQGDSEVLSMSTIILALMKGLQPRRPALHVLSSENNIADEVGHDRIRHDNRAL